MSKNDFDTYDMQELRDRIDTANKKVTCHRCGAPAAKEDGGCVVQGLVLCHQCGDELAS